MIAIVGAALIALPILAMIVFMIRQVGWRQTLAIWALSVAAAGCVTVGILLLVFR